MVTSATGLEKDGISCVIPNDQACNILIGGINFQEEEPPIKCSHASSVASDIATEEEIASAVPSTSTSLHSATSPSVCLTTPSLNQYDSSVIPMKPRAREDLNHISLPGELIPIIQTLMESQCTLASGLAAPMPQYKIRHPNVHTYEEST